MCPKRCLPETASSHYFDITGASRTVHLRAFVRHRCLYVTSVHADENCLKAHVLLNRGLCILECTDRNIKLYCGSALYLLLQKILCNVFKFLEHLKGTNSAPQ